MNLLLLAGLSFLVAQTNLELKPNDDVCIIGNTLADRMQHDGWFETMLQLRQPDHRLVIRNLGFSGDELTLRLRSQDFGTPDQWLTRCKADVVFAFFGYNESFAGEAGLAKFKSDLDEFIRHTLSQKFNGSTPPRLVLCSPIAHENLHDPHLPDGSENNRRIAVYVAAMADVVRKHNVAFVDLYQPSLALYAETKSPLTINGVHLNPLGNRRIAEVLQTALFGGRGESLESPAAEKLRQAIADKNFYWFNRYRTVDGYSMYGGRADLKFINGQTNRVVMDRELEVLDTMTANRDRHIWEVAAALKAGRQPPDRSTIDDSNTPPFIPVITNKPGPLTGGKHVFLSSEEAIKRMTVAKNLKVNLFASEETVKELVNPVQMTWDPQGRLWVAVWPTYPHWKPKEDMNDKLLILEDTDGDGRADKVTVFADHLHCPTGFEFYRGGVLIAQAPDLMYLRDTNGDGKADVRERVLHGLDSADTHHTANSFTLDPGGGLYFQEGTFHHTQVETPWGPPLRNANAGVYRYEPRTQKFDAYISYGFANPHGHVFDKWGQDIVVDGTGSNPFHAALFSGHVDFPMKHNRPPQVYQQWTRPCPGIEYLSSRHFPPEWQGNLLVANVIGYQGILQYKISDDGASFAGAEAERLLSSDDPSFRPSDLKIGPDGALYFIDWHNPIIGHMQHNLRDPSRDREHGRIYRVTYEGRPLVAPMPIAGQPIEKLLDLLKEPEDRVRYRARIELAGRDSEAVKKALSTWISQLDKGNAEYERHLLEALWLMQNHDIVHEPLLSRVLKSLDFRARAAATRVLCYWRDRIPDSLYRLLRLATDAHPRVRLEAVRAASFYTNPEAIEVALAAANQPTDRFIDFVNGETLRTLEPIVKQSLDAGRSIQFKTEAGARYLIRSVALDQLLKMDRSKAVCLELLFRPGVPDDQRRDALRSLARIDTKSELAVLLDAVRLVDEKKEARDDSVVFDLVRLLKGRSAPELASARGDIEKLALSAKQPAIRQIAYVGLIDIDGSADKAWQSALASPAALIDLLDAVHLIPDTTVRTSLFPRIESLIHGLPKSLAIVGRKSKPITGRYVRIELPGSKRTLTLAEVEVYSNNQNIARRGAASQVNTAQGGKASRAIDGNKSGSYSAGGQTHTQEGLKNPWWEVDLHSEHPIDAIAIYNRADDNLGARLNNFTLKILDRRRNVVFEKTKQPAPEIVAKFVLAAPSQEMLVRHAAFEALVSIPGREADAFAIVSKRVLESDDRPAAIKALQRLPKSVWSKDAAPMLVDAVVAGIRKTPVADRTSPETLAALEFADTLSTLLPANRGKAIRKELSQLGVRVIRIGTLPERMAYDKDVIAIEAGRPVEFIFENGDLMPHNLAIVEPGSMEEIGMSAEATATQPDAAARDFIPRSNRILLASKLLQPRDSQKLSFMAPKTPGVYPYVCTYPGHWRRMFGALYVVADLDEYRANPDSYLAGHKLAIKDELLKDRRARTEWKFEELEQAVTGLSTGRSLDTAKQVFRLANCVACHKLDGVGNQFGPELAKLDPKMTPTEILKNVLDPSAKIDDKFASHSFVLDNGKVVTGLIVEETTDSIKVIENPLASAKPTTLKKSEIESRKKSAVSLMPKGLLDRLSKEEVLDLIAYLASRGEQKSSYFQGATGHHHH